LAWWNVVVRAAACAGLDTRTPANGPPQTRQRQQEWRRLRYDAGYPPGLAGGGGGSPIYDAIFNEEAAAVGAPGLPLMYFERVVIMAGTPEQREKFVIPSMRGEIGWCQGFSEPSGGSDLAALKTRAVIDGDHYVVNGAKLWTGGAATADWCFLLARTEPDAPKHNGISILFVDMKTPGVRPGVVRTSDGSDRTGECGFEDVIVPVENRIGEPGAGWRLAMQALAYERGLATWASCPITARRCRSSRTSPPSVAWPATRSSASGWPGPTSSATS
jgi:alkylation response protein AidB-like acyl-CoA dehydrogenase